MLFLIIERRARSAQCTQLFKQKFYYVTKYSKMSGELVLISNVLRVHNASNCCLNDKVYYVTMYKEKLREIGSMPTIVRRIGFALWLIVAFRQRNG
jgi:hypothetical protein